MASRELKDDRSFRKDLKAAGNRNRWYCSHRKQELARSDELSSRSGKEQSTLGMTHTWDEVSS